MNPELSHLAKRLRSLPVPILCRNEAERVGVERTALACAECVRQGHRLEDHMRKVGWLTDEAWDRLSEARTAEIIALAGEVTATCTEASALAEIKALLDEHAQALEPSASLARAIHHLAFQVPKEHRQTWNKERVGAYVFHKLKRGCARIYVRVEGDAITFHAYARKNWEKFV